MVQVQSGTSLAIDAPQARKLFVFDRVFSPDIDQEGIWEYLSECVSSFTQGYNVSLLAYGQSGAGKSYTMGTSGPAEQDDMEVMGKSASFFRGDNRRQKACCLVRARLTAARDGTITHTNTPRRRCHSTRRERVV